MRVFVTGGTGFVGRELVNQLLAAEHEVICLARPGSEGKLARHDRLRIQPGDAVSGDGLAQGMAGCDAVIHLIGIIRAFPARGITFDKLHVQATERVVAACRKNGIRRYLHMSANGTRPDAVSPYHQTKWRAEERVRQSELDWTIFRP
ncbi:MAG: NAD-dependent epimerase/dehydratase family protein, partial [Alphaproteobacteria bacterium]